MATGDMFLKIDGIDGESLDAKHKGEMQITSWSWGESNEGSSSLGGGAGAGKVHMHDFHFTIDIGKHSPKLMEKCAIGKPAGKAILTVRKAGGEQEEFMKWTFSDVQISSYSVSASSNGGVLPQDNCSFNFTKIEQEYKEQKPDGTLGGAIKAGWDVKQNVKV